MEPWEQYQAQAKPAQAPPAGQDAPWTQYQAAAPKSEAPPKTQAAPWEDYKAPPPAAEKAGPWSEYGADASPKQGAGIADAALAIPRAAAAGVKDIYKETMKEGVQNTEDIKGDFTAPVQSHDKQGVPGKPGAMDYAARAGKTAMDMAWRPFIPARAALRETFGRSANEATRGALDTDAVTDAAMIAWPLSKSKMVGKGIEGVSNIAEKLFSPTTVSPGARAVERISRRATGESKLVNEKAADRLVQHNKVLSNMPVADQRAFIDDMENGRPIKDPKLAAAAKDIRGTYDTWRNRITAVLPKAAVPNFIQDYYAHMWKENPATVGQKMQGFSKQGSGASLKKRSIPTIADGIRAGLTPKYENPIEATMAYSQNMARYVATHDILKELKVQGYAKWFTPGSKNIPKDWVPLDGIMTKKNAPGTRAVAAGSNTGQPVRIPDRPIQLYAPQNAARVFNNSISKGFNQHETGGDVYDGIRKVANGMTMLKLGLSTFHLATIANESIISDYARAFRAASRGEVKTALKATVGGLANTFTLGGKSAMRGLKMQRELLDKAMPDSMSKVVNDAFVRSGGTLKMDPFLRTRASGSFYNALEKGTFKRELKDAAGALYKGSAGENAKGAVDLVANVIQSTAAPLFEKYIPLVKRGAFASEMEDFLKATPHATQAEIDKEAIKIADSIDNRFGELNQDNLFWNKYMKQVAQISLLSPTWTVGTLREIGGGLKDAMGAAPAIAKGEGISRRTAYLAGLAANTALMNAVATYLKTGTAPHGRDFMAYRTGGTDATSGQPERAMTPGYQKDVYAFGYDFPHNIQQESINKLNPAVQAAWGLATNKDYRGLPIYRPEGVAPQTGEPNVMDYLLEQTMPISVGQFSKGRKLGSNLSLPERLMSVRPAPSYVTDPDRVEANKEKYNTRDWRKRIKADQREKSRLEP